MTALLGILASSSSSQLLVAPTLVSSTSGANSSGNAFGASTISISMPSGLVAGNDIFVRIGSSRGTADWSPDLPGFTKIFDSRLVNGSSRGAFFIYRKPNITGSETAVTFTHGVNGSGQTAYVAEQWEGVGSIEVPDVDGVSSSTSGVHTINLNTITTTGAQRVVLSGVGGRGPSSGDIAETWGGGATVQFGTATGQIAALTTAMETLTTPATRTHTCQVNNTQGAPALCAGSIILNPEEEGVEEWNGPAYVPTEYQDEFNLDTGGFNFNPTNTANIVSALEGADTGHAEIMVAGNSFAEGWNSYATFTADRLHAFPLMMRDAIADSLSINVAGTGHVRCRSIQLVNHYHDERWNDATTNTLAWTNGGHLITANSTSDPAIIFDSGAAATTGTLGRTGTKVKIRFIDTDGDLRVSIDGGADQIITGNGTNLPRTHTISGLANTTHTVSIRPNTNENITIGGVEVTNDVGITVHNVAQGGSRVTTTGQDVWPATALGYGQLGLFYSHANMHGNAQILLLELGGNDLQSDPQTEAEIQPILDGYEATAALWPSADVVLFTAAKGGSGFDANYDLYWEMVFQQAIDNNWPVIDIQYITGGYSNMVTQGWTDDQYGHLSVAGAQFFGDAVAQAILVGAGLI